MKVVYVVQIPIFFFQFSGSGNLKKSLQVCWCHDLLFETKNMSIFISKIEDDSLSLTGLIISISALEILSSSVWAKLILSITSVLSTTVCFLLVSLLKWMKTNYIPLHSSTLFIITILFFDYPVFGKILKGFVWNIRNISRHFCRYRCAKYAG